ncbi:MAG: hypothetical protein WHF31_15250 [Candidatus Dehalobacter alkaniphilus]
MTELEKLKDIFSKVDPPKQKLVEKLVYEAAFLSDENDKLRDVIREVGMIKIHPTRPDLQKPTEAGKQYLKNLAAYAIVIKTLNSVLTKNSVEEDDEYAKFIKEQSDADE